MKKTVVKVVILAVILSITAITAITGCSAARAPRNVTQPQQMQIATQKQTIELRTRSALLIDRSGSMDDRQKVDEILSQIDTTSYDVVAYFDHRQSTTDPAFVGGGNSYICEKIHEMATGGFTHISVVTDGQQWPQDYSSIGIYSDLDIKFYLTEESKDSEELINQLKGRMVNSTLKVKTPDGAEKVILNEYEPPVYTIEIPMQDISSLEERIQELEAKECKWWLALLLATLLAMLFDFIHELITRPRGQTTTGATQTPVNKPTAAVASTATTPPVVPLPQNVIDKIAGGAVVLADFSGSMAAQQQETRKACLKAGTEKVISFASDVKEVKPSDLDLIQAGGRTAGWEAVETAYQKGCKEIVIISDLEFNGKSFERSRFSIKFEKVTVVTPTSYKKAVYEQLKEITDEIEVVYL